MGEMPASENETSDSSRDNFSTSKLVDTFDSNLRELCAVLPPLSYDLLRCPSTMRPITSKSCFQREQPDLVELLDLYPDDRPWEWRKREFVKRFAERELINIVDQCIPCTEKIKRYGFGPGTKNKLYWNRY